MRVLTSEHDVKPAIQTKERQTCLSPRLRLPRLMILRQRFLEHRMHGVTPLLSVLSFEILLSVKWKEHKCSRQFVAFDPLTREDIGARRKRNVVAGNLQ